MDHEHFDRLARAMAAGVSRRSMLRRAAGSAMTSPLALVGDQRAAAQGNKDKDKDKGQEGPRETRAIRATREALGQAAAAARGIPARGTRSAVRGWSVRRRRATRPRGMRGAARRSRDEQTVVNDQESGLRRRLRPDQPADGDRREPRVLWHPPELLDRRGLHLRRPALPDGLRLHRLRPAHGAGRAHDHPAAGRHLRRSSSRRRCGPLVRRAPRRTRRRAGRRTPAPAVWRMPTPAAARSRSVMSAGTMPTSPSMPVAARPIADASGGDNNVAIAGGGQIGDDAAQGGGVEHADT